MNIELNIPSPVQFLGEISNGVRLYIKREDLIHPLFGGNKWRKLKYNIRYFQDSGFKTMVTFGGPFSNHIAAVAQICHYHGIPSAGIIRGTYKDADNPSLNAARQAGMKLHHIPKDEYALKDNSELVQSIIGLYKRPYLVPEGGSNLLARKGVRELVDEIDNVGQYDCLFLPAGTGMTAAGLICGIETNNCVRVINVLKNKSLASVIKNNIVSGNARWKVESDYNFGGFAKVPEQLVEFNRGFWKQYGILLDPVYNAKAMYALFDMASKGLIGKGASVLYLHTGGLQGIKAWEYVQKKVWVK